MAPSLVGRPPQGQPCQRDADARGQYDGCRGVAMAIRTGVATRNETPEVLPVSAMRHEPEGASTGNSRPEPVFATHARWRTLDPCTHGVAAGWTSGPLPQ